MLIASLAQIVRGLTAVDVHRLFRAGGLLRTLRVPKGSAQDVQALPFCWEAVVSNPSWVVKRADVFKSFWSGTASFVHLGFPQVH